MISTSIGPMTLVADEEHLLEIRFGSSAMDVGVDGSPWLADREKSLENTILDQAEREIVEYLEGHRREFTVPIRWQGTEFQNRVWNALLRIGYGETTSYVELAQRIGCPKGARAVGTTVGRNPLSILVPCHRVIGSNGTLVGFAGGVDIKRRLLDLEAHALCS